MDIPTYKYSYKIDELTNGKYSLKLRVRQEDVPENFRMIVPVKIEYDDENYQMERLVIEGVQSEFGFTDLEDEPDEIIFNAMEGVLCKVDKEGWE